MSALRPDRGVGDAPELTDRVLRDALGPLLPPAGGRHAIASTSAFPLALAGTRADRGSRESRSDLVVVVDDGPSMGIWSSTVDGFVRALIGSDVFRDVLVRRLATDGRGEPVLRGPGPGAPGRGVGELVAPNRRRLVLVVTDGVDPVWRSGEAWAPLRRWGSAHQVAVVSLLPWSAAVRLGFEVHRLRLSAPEPAAPNARTAWQPQVDVPGVFEDFDAVLPVAFVELDSTGLARWARLAAGAGWVDTGALLIPTRSGERPPEPVAGTPAEVVGAYRTTASPSAFDLAVHLAAAPLELDLMSLVCAILHPNAGRAALSEFLGSSLVVLAPERGDKRNQVIYEFAAPGIRDELLAYGRRRDTARVRALVAQYLGERVPGLSAFDTGLDEEITRLSGDRLIAGIPHVLEAALAGERALSGRHLRNYRHLIDSASVAPLNGPSYVQTQTPGEESKAGGAALTSTAVDGEREGRRRTFAAPVFGNVPPRNPAFTGRGDLLAELERRLVPGATTALLPEALHGMGGVGKSQLAAEYAYRNRGRFDLIWWISAERPLKIVNSLVELGQRLGFSAGAEANLAVQEVLDALKGAWHPNVPAKWLLVFDNADSPTAVQPYLPIGGSGHIIVTSRNSQWLTVARPLEVAVFHRSESVQLLRRRDPELSEHDADRLAEALGDLPLAIAQVAAWRAETGMPAGEYLELLAEKELELLDVTTAVDYPKSVAAMWNLSLNQLKRKNPSALRLLQACAFLAPEPISRPMLAYGRNIDTVPELKAVLRDRVKLNEAIRDANRLALVRLDHRTNSIELHRLAQAIVKSQMSDQEREEMRHAALQILGANDPETPTEVDRWPLYADLESHMMAVNAWDSDIESVRTLIINLAVFLYYWGEHGRAVKTSERVYLNWRERLGPKHPETLQIGRWYGSMLWVVGRYEEAARLNADLLPIHHEVFGEAHEDTIELVGSVAADNRARGDFAAALELSTTNYRNCVRYLGDEDQLTLNEAHNLAVSRRLAGRYREALELDQDTLERKTQIFGFGHNQVLNTQVGLAIDLRELGHYREAREQQEETVRQYQDIVKSLNPALLRSLLHLAVMRRKAGDHKGALEAAETALNGLTTRYGPDHADTLAAALCRSVELRHHGRIGVAIQLGQDTLTRYARTLGADHPHTLAAAVNVAVLRRSVGDHEGARDLDRSTFDGLRRRLGDDHPSTLVAAINLASDLYALGDVHEAHQLDVDTLRRVTEVLGPGHPTTLACKANLAQDLRSLGQAVEGDRLHREAVDALREALGPDHPAVSQLRDREARANCDIDPMPL